VGREVQVLRLIAAGHSNRAEAAAYATRQGLAG